MTFDDRYKAATESDTPQIIRQVIKLAVIILFLTGKIKIP